MTTIDPVGLQAVLEQPSTAWLGTFGMEVQLDIAGCDPQALADPDVFRAWLADLVDSIGMTAYGDPLIVPFGEGSLYGVTAVQLITTSNIIAHGVDADSTLFVNVFSCQPFPTNAAVEVTMRHFRGQRYQECTTVRRAPEVTR